MSKTPEQLEDEQAEYLRLAGMAQRRGDWQLEHRYRSQAARRGRDRAALLAQGKDPLTYDDVFPWAWDGPLQGSGLMECGLCGGAVANTEKHVDWHNEVAK